MFASLDANTAVKTQRFIALAAGLSFSRMTKLSCIIKYVEEDLK
jgi:hypothetical protein